MNKEELFASLFPLPYSHEKWLVDQAILLKRLKKEKNEYLKEQAKILTRFQKLNQCSSLFLDILVERIDRHEKKCLTSEETDVIINSMSEENEAT